MIPANLIQILLKTVYLISVYLFSSWAFPKESSHVSTITTTSSYFGRICRSPSLIGRGYLCSCSLEASSSCSCWSLSLCWRTDALWMSNSLFRAAALFSSSCCRFIWGRAARFTHTARAERPCLLNPFFCLYLLTLQEIICRMNYVFIFVWL